GGWSLLEIGTRRSNLCLKESRVKLSHDLPLLDVRIEIGIERRDRPRDLASNLNRGDRLQRACSTNCVPDRSAIDSRRHVVFGVGSGIEKHSCSYHACNQQRTQGKPPYLSP